jgi:hypothetical protein
MSKEKKYFSGASRAAAGSSKAAQLDRLQQELKQQVGQIDAYEEFTAEWFAMTEAFRQIANVANLEAAHAESAGVVSDQQKAMANSPLRKLGKKEGGTLWDQHRDELAVRTLIEGGRLQVCQAVLQSFCKLRRNGEAYAEAVALAVVECDKTAQEIAKLAEVFEGSLGQLLVYTVMHVEALQIMDVPSLLRHCSEVLLDGLKSHLLIADCQGTQMTHIFSYIFAIATAMEDMDEDAVMAWCRQCRLLPLLARQLAVHYTWYKLDSLGAAALALSLFMHSDAYGVDAAVFFATEQQKRDIVALKGLFLSQLIDDYGMPRHKLSSLLRQIQVWERELNIESQFVPLPQSCVLAGYVRIQHNSGGVDGSRDVEREREHIKRAGGNAVGNSGAVAISSAPGTVKSSSLSSSSSSSSSASTTTTPSKASRLAKVLSTPPRDSKAKRLSDEEEDFEF